MTAAPHHPSPLTGSRVQTSPRRVGWGSSRGRGEGQGRPGGTTGSGSPPGPSPLDQPAQPRGRADRRRPHLRALVALRPHISLRRTA